MPKPNKLRGVFEKIPSSGVWWIQYFKDGKRRREKAGTKATAIKLLDKRRGERLIADKLPETVKARAVRFSELLDDAQAKAKLHNGKSAQSNLRGIVDALKPEFGERIASTITTNELQSWLLERRDENDWAEGTFNHYVVQLRLVFRGGIKAKKVFENPAQDLEKLAVDNEKPRFLTPEEEDALDVAINEHFPHHRDAFIFARNTGLRAGAQFDLRWEQINFRKREMTLPPKRNSKYRKNWVLPLNDAAWWVIAKRKDNNSEFVFPEYQTPAWMVNPAHWFPAIVAAAGVQDFTWHGLRHNFASQLCMKGVNLKMVQMLMCHTDIKQTAKYADLSADHLREAVSMMMNLGGTSGGTSLALSA